MNELSGRENQVDTVTTLCLVRHGESVWNAEKRWQGQLDPELSDDGLKQAKLVAERLAAESWSAVYSSDLSRARQTAEAIADKIGLSVRTDAALRERGQGKREGLLFSEARERFPDPTDPAIGIEPVEAMKSRTIDGIEKIRDSHRGERVIVVAHNGLIRTYLRTILPSLDGVTVHNTSCTLLSWDGKRWQCVYLADASHLDESEHISTTG